MIDKENSFYNYAVIILIFAFEIDDSEHWERWTITM